MNIGGTACYVGNVVQHIPNNALSVGFVQGDEIEDPVVHHLRVYRINGLGRKIDPIHDFLAWLELRKLIKTLQPAIVHTHTFKAGLIGRLIRGKHKRIHTFHGHLFGDHSFSTLEKKIILIVERYLARRTDLIISVGERVGRELRGAGIGPDRDWLSIPPGVNSLPKIDKVVARGLLNIDVKFFFVGWMARMTAVKNPFLLLEVAKLLPDVQFVMAGGGDLLEEVRRSSPKNVTVIGWVDASLFWSAVDCAISTSNNEGMPIALIEAQLAGLPVVATNVGSNSEVIISGQTGVICEGNAKEIATALLGLISNQDVLDSMTESAKKLALQRFRLDKMLDSHKLLYEKIVE